MKLPPAPIRFLLLVVGLWVTFRAFAWLPDRSSETVAGGQSDSAATQVATAGQPVRDAQIEPSTSAAVASPNPFAAASTPSTILHWPEGAAWHGTAPPSHGVVTIMQAPAVPIFHAPNASDPAPMVAPSTATYPPFRLAEAPHAPTPGARRWSASAWLFLRDEGAGTLAPGGTLGGSQAGLRVAYRLNGDARRPLGLTSRLYLPVDRPGGAEAAIGIDWQPFTRLPIHILAERRERLGEDGRSDFGLTVYGGVERRVLRGRIRLEAYGQAGIVGVQDRDLFADGSVRASIKAGPVEIGAGAWGGAQFGASRLDVGPHATFRLPVGRTTIRASADWRFRIAGEAAPNSGPALTLATDF